MSADVPPAAVAATSSRGSRRAQRAVACAQEVVAALEAWAGRGPVRRIVVTVLVTVLGPVVILAGVAMTVLPGPGLVVIGLGLGLLALEYSWARHALGLIGRTLSAVTAAAIPPDASRLRRGLGVAGAGAFFVATFALTTAVTAYLGAHTFL
jgi:uncharacterized protein (TIGR02611 family)